MGNIICYVLVAFIMVGTGNVEYIKSNEVNDTLATWNELGYDEYLATAWEEKNLNKSELCSLKHMGFSKDEIQKMSQAEAKQHLYDLKIASEEYNDAISMQYFEYDIFEWRDIAIVENFVWSDGKSTINSHLIDEFIDDMKNGSASTIIMYKNVICDVDYDENEGILITIYKEDSSKQKIVCDNILVNEDGYWFEDCDIVLQRN